MKAASLTLPDIGNSRKKRTHQYEIVTSANELFYNF